MVQSSYEPHSSNSCNNETEQTQHSNFSLRIGEKRESLIALSRAKIWSPFTNLIGLKVPLHPQSTWSFVFQETNIGLIQNLVKLCKNVTVPIFVFIILLQIKCSVDFV
jgi:hypothetical protein